MIRLGAESPELSTPIVHSSQAARDMNMSDICGHPSGLEQLEGLPLQLIALKLSNPGPLIASCSAAHRSVMSNYQRFQVEWFLHWAPVLVPHRPWQYAAVTWRCLGGSHATAESLCLFMLACLNAKRRPHQEYAQLLQHFRALQLQANTQQQQPQPQQQHNGQQSGKALRESYSPFPGCVPQLSILRQVSRLLARGHATKALLLLCPGPPLLLPPYLSRAGNLPLLKQVLSLQADSSSDDSDALYPEVSFLLSSGVARTVCTAQLCAYAAMATGNDSMLAFVLMSGGNTFKEEPYRLGQLFRFACRHSSRSCLQLIVDCAPCSARLVRRLQPWHQHIAMAAARTDVWAADVLELLLQVAAPKQRSAKAMGGAYTAACRTGHVPVLQQLLSYAAADSAAHMQVLLQAAAKAGNLTVWQQLLMQPAVLNTARPAQGTSRSEHSPIPGASSLGQPLQDEQLSGQAPSTDKVQPATSCAQQQQQQQQQLQQQGSPGEDQQHQLAQCSATCCQGGRQLHTMQQLLVPALPWHTLPVEALIAALDSVLEGVSSSISTLKCNGFVDRVRDSRLIAMADMFWQYLTEHPAVLQDFKQHYAAGLWFMHRSVIRVYGPLVGLFKKAQLPVLLWLHEHQLLPQPQQTLERDEWSDYAFEAMAYDCAMNQQPEQVQELLQLCSYLQLELPPAAAIMVEGVVAAAMASAVQTGDLGSWGALIAFRRQLWDLRQLMKDVEDEKYTEWPTSEKGSCLCWKLITRAEQLYKAHQGAGLGVDLPTWVTAITAGVQHRLPSSSRCRQALLAALQQWQDHAAVQQRDCAAAPFTATVRCSCGAAAAAAAAAGSGGQQPRSAARTAQNASVRQLPAVAADGGDGDDAAGNSAISAAGSSTTYASARGSSSDRSSSSSSSDVADTASSTHVELGAAGRGSSSSSTQLVVPQAQSTRGADQQDPVNVQVAPLWQLAALKAAVKESHADPYLLSSITQGPAAERLVFNGTHSLRVSAAAAAAAAAAAEGGACPGHNGAAVFQWAPDKHTVPVASAAAVAASMCASDATAVHSSMVSAAAGARPAPAGVLGVTAAERALLQTAVLLGASDGCLDVHWDHLLHRLDALAWLLDPANADALRMEAKAKAWVNGIRYGWRTVLGIPSQPGTEEPDEVDSSIEQLREVEQQQVEAHSSQLAAGVTWGFPPLPRCAAAAAELVRVTMMLPYPPMPGPGRGRQVGNNITECVSGSSSAATLDKVKAMLAVVAGAPQEVLARSWPIVLLKAMRQVQAAGDIDLMALLLLFDQRADLLLEAGQVRTE